MIVVLPTPGIATSIGGTRYILTPSLRLFTLIVQFDHDKLAGFH